MNIIKFLITAAVTLASILFLNERVQTSGGTLPPPGKFLNPFNGFWQNALNHESEPIRSDNLPGLKDEVTISYDAHLVPHIYAKNNEDAFYMQGYISARHRLWQMEFQTHAASGRISEIVGERALPLDREKRRMGLTYGAKNALEFLSKDELAMNIMNAYCAGVNDYIDQLKRKDYPVEYKLLDYAPEEWKPIKTALLLTYMANVLSGSENDIENTNFINTYDETLFKQLYQHFYEGQDPIIPKTHKYKTVNTTQHDIPETQQASISEISHSKPSPLIGSNNWALAGSRTSTGLPMLANDPHLRLTLPSIWFQMHMVTPDCNVYGVTFPGAPNIIIGFNNDIAWGITNSGRDVRDWFQIEFTNDSKTKYLHDGQEKPVIVTEEKYDVRGGQAFTETLRYTHHGPVVYDDDYPVADGKTNLALQWTAHHPTSELLTFYHLNRAANHQEYIKALDLYQAPAQNFVFACKDGDIAIKQQGKFPLYSDLKGSFLNDGRDPENDWTDYIPNEGNPHIKNPERGFVSSANQHPTDSTYPYIYSGIFEFFRNRRLNKLLEKSENATAIDHMNWQLDNFNLQASESLPIFLQYLDRSKLNDEESDVAKLLSEWNFMNERGLTAPSYYQAWWDIFNQLTWDEMLNAEIAMAVPHKYATIRIMADHPDHPFFDNQSTEQIDSIADIVQLSFVNAVAHINKQSETNNAPPQWWRIKDTEINHLALLPAFGRLHIPCDGNKGILNATGKYWGPSWRMIVELGDSVKAFGIYPGGQSGSPGSPYYDNFIDDWAEGIYYPIQFNSKPSSDAEKSLFTQILKPIN